MSFAGQFCSVIASSLKRAGTGRSGPAGSSNFPDDTPFPGLDLSPYNWFSTEGLFHLDLPAGYHRLGVNSDDGFEVDLIPPPGVAGAPIALGIYDDGRGAADTLFDFLVTAPGLYTFQVIYFESTGLASEEFFSVSNLATGEKTLINEPATASAIKSYRVLKPRITRIVRSGPNAVIDWAYGTPPFQLESTTNVANPVWTDLGSATSNRTASVLIQPSPTFIRVRGQ